MSARRMSLVVALLVLMSTFCLSFAIIPNNVEATTLYVGGTGPGNYTYIMSAVIAAQPGDTVYVYSGTYYEGLVILKSISLVGEDRNTTIIDLDDTPGLGDVIFVFSDWVNITGFTITNSGSTFDNDAGVHLDYSDNCYIADNNISSNNMFGVYLTESRYNTITNNIVSLNRFEGILFEHSDNNTIANNHIANNTVDDHAEAGIWIYSSSHVNIASNTFYSKSGNSVRIERSDENILFNNTVHSSDGFGFYIRGSDWTTIINNTILDSGSGISLKLASNNTIANNTSSYGGRGVGLSESTHNIVTNNVLSHNGIGIDIQTVTPNTVLSNIVSSNRYGVMFRSSGNLTAINNTITNNTFGIVLDSSFDNKIANNNIFSNDLDGIRLSFSSSNTISNNTLSDNWDNIYLFYSTANTISNNSLLSSLDGIDLSYHSNGNTIVNNMVMYNKYGFYAHLSDSNAIHHNSIVDNLVQAYENGINFWDDGYPSGGNYWSDHDIVDVNSGPDQDLPGSDEINDVAYDIIGGAGRDRYPLVNPVGLSLPRPPTAPRNLRAISGDQKATLVWRIPSSDGGSAITNYWIYRGTSAGSETFLVETGNVLKYVDTGLVNGQAYYYLVSAVNAQGGGGTSNEAMAIPVSGPAQGDPPHIVVDKSADPNTVWLEGTAHFPQETTVTLDVAGAGSPLSWPMPQDIVFVIDTSGSMGAHDPENLRLTAPKAYLDLMKPPDRAATVWFEGYGYLTNGTHLTSEYDRVKADIDSIPPPGGGTDSSAGLRLGIDELIGYGHPDHTRAVILLTDGHDRSGLTISEAYRAANMGVTVYVMGLNPASPEDIAFLQQITSISGGVYYPAPTPDALADIYFRSSQGQKILDVAGTKIEDSIEPNPMIRDVLPPFIHYVPGSFRDQNSIPCPPELITANPDGSTVLDWDLEKIIINQSWVVRYEVTSSLGGYVPVGVYPLSRVNYTKWDYSPESLPFPDVHIFVLDPGAVPQPLDPPFLRAETNQKDIILNWTSSGPNTSYYLIYRATDQREFDFSNPIYNTSQDPEPLRMNWTDVGAAGENSSREYYYVVRALNNIGTKSGTSNTVGKWTREFVRGVNAFSPPLEPFENRNISWYAIDIPNLNYIRWANSTGHWVTHIPGTGEGVNDKPLEMGEGYEVFLTSNTTYTFMGSPASMIRFQEGLGDSVSYRKSLSAQIEGSDINLSWEAVDGASVYLIFRSEKRDGFHNLSLSPIAITNETHWRDAGIIGNQESEHYYMVIPVGSQGELGSSTYSIGVFTLGYYPGSDTFALPLKPTEVRSIDWYCDNIPRVVGIVHLMKGYWRLHAREMPEGVYDTIAIQGEGYQILIHGLPARYIFVGY